MSGERQRFPAPDGLDTPPGVVKKKKPNRSLRCMAVGYRLARPGVKSVRAGAGLDCPLPVPEIMAPEPLLRCPIMSGLVERHGPVRITPRPPFRSLVHAIVSQQISGKAADSILTRLRSQVPMTPAALAKADLRRLRRVGLSRAKATYVRELSRFASAGGLRGLARLDDAAIVERLITVKGVGVWTAEMFLIFSLARPDVWPVDDGGVQRAARKLYGTRTPKGLARLGDRFRPHRSAAAWYFWRYLDQP